VVRSLCAIVVGVVAWFVVATIGNLLLRVMIPGYAAVEAAMTFTLPMQVSRLALGLVSSVCSGALCAAIARSNAWEVKVTALVMLALFIPVHYALRARFPLWYHAFFLITLAPAVMLGAATSSTSGARHFRP
jgi:hypothetical protein